MRLMLLALGLCLAIVAASGNPLAREEPAKDFIVNRYLPQPFGPHPAPSAVDPIAGFREPAAGHRPIMVWYWNADPDQATMRDQIRQMHEAGCGGISILPMPDSFRKRDFFSGMQTEYLSDEFFGFIRFAVDEAVRAGMQVWLYDEGGWPSGHALHKVAEGHPDFSGWVLRRTADGVEVARGGYPADLMNPQAVRRFIDLTHERYAQFVGHEFGRAVTSVFTDEMRVGGSLGSDTLPWTPDLPRLFRERKGYDLGPLEALFGDDESTARLRYDYTDVWSSLFREAYMDQIRDWCREHGLLSMGHFPGEDEFAGPVRYGFGDVMRGLEGFDMPAVDAIWRQIFPGRAHPDFPRLAASAERQGGKRCACTESFAVYGWSLTPAQMKWLTDFQFVRGINLMIPMQAVYDLAGPGMANTASHLAWGNPMWRFFRHYADYTARLGWMLSQGEPVIRVAVYVPVRSLWVNPKDQTAERSLTALAQGLLSRQVDFDYIGDDALQRAVATNGALSVGPMRYQALVIPKCGAIPAATLRLIDEAAGAGVLVAAVGRPRSAADNPGESKSIDDAWRHVAEAADEDAAAQIVEDKVGRTVELAPACADVRCCRRTAPDFDIAFLTNESGRTLNFAVASPETCDAYLCDAETGQLTALQTRQAAGQGAVRIHLEPWGSALVLFDRGVRVTGAVTPKRPARVLRAASLEWSARPIERLTVTEQGIQVAQLHEAARALPFNGWRAVDPYFSDQVEYTATVELGQAAGVTLDMGNVRHVVELWVNDQPVGTRCWRPYRFDIGRYLKPGRNVLRAVVTNTLANEFARPETKELMRRMGWQNGYRNRAEGFEAEELDGSTPGP